MYSIVKHSVNIHTLFIHIFIIYMQFLRRFTCNCRPQLWSLRRPSNSRRLDYSLDSLCMSTLHTVNSFASFQTHGEERISLVEVKPGESHLIIRNLVRGDTGSYTCVVSNRAGVARQNATLVVQCKLEANTCNRAALAS